MGESQFISTSHSRWPISLRILFGLPPPPTHTDTKKQSRRLRRQKEPADTDIKKSSSPLHRREHKTWLGFCVYTHTGSLTPLYQTGKRRISSCLLIKVGGRRSYCYNTHHRTDGDADAPPTTSPFPRFWAGQLITLFLRRKRKERRGRGGGEMGAGQDAGAPRPFIRLSLYLESRRRGGGREGGGPSFEQIGKREKTY